MDGEKTRANKHKHKKEQTQTCTQTWNYTRTRRNRQNANLDATRNIKHTIRAMRKYNEFVICELLRAYVLTTVHVANLPLAAC